MTTQLVPWTPGTACWADMTVPDLPRAVAFYGPLLGWRFETGGPETGGYTQAFVDDRQVVGLTEPMGEDPAPPAAWCVYLAADDLPGTVAHAEQLGARTLLGPLEVRGFGAMALLSDPTGAVVGLWRPGAHLGWEVVDEPGAVRWTEHMSHDQARALAFYDQLFGYEVTDLSAPDFAYASVGAAGEPVRSGIGGYGPGAAPDVPAAWTVYFQVPGVDDAAVRVAELGGTVVSPPEDTPNGRMVLATGPFGEVFALMEPPAEQPVADTPPF